MHDYTIETDRLILRPLMEKCGLHFVGYCQFQKLDGTCKMRSMEYEMENTI